MNMRNWRLILVVKMLHMLAATTVSMGHFVSDQHTIVATHESTPTPDS